MDPGKAADVQAASRLATAVDALAWEAHTQLGVDVTIKNPAHSFMWELGLFEWPTGHDAVFPPCMLGDDINKPTRIRSLGIRLASMIPKCVWYESKKTVTCGRTRDRTHVHLYTKPRGRSKNEHVGSGHLPTGNRPSLGTKH